MVKRHEFRDNHPKTQIWINLNYTIYANVSYLNAGLLRDNILEFGLRRALYETYLQLFFKRLFNRSQAVETFQRYKKVVLV